MRISQTYLNMAIYIVRSIALFDKQLKIITGHKLNDDVVVQQFVAIFQPFWNVYDATNSKQHSTFIGNMFSFYQRLFFIIPFLTCCSPPSTPVPIHILFYILVCRACGCGMFLFRPAPAALPFHIVCFVLVELSQNVNRIWTTKVHCMN